MFIGRLMRAGSGWVQDQAAQMGAALAYYTLFSLTPLLIFAVGLISNLYGSEAESRAQILAQARAHLGPDGAEAVRLMLDNFRMPRVGVSVLGVASLLFGSLGMFMSLRSSLQRIWRLPPPKEGLLMSILKGYLLALLMVFVSCAFLVVLLLVSAAMPLIAPIWAARFPQLGAWSGPALDLLVSVFLLFLLFVFTFRFMSDGRIRYVDVLGGALVTALLFTVGKMAIGLYIAYANLASAYGAAGSVVVFLAWVYYSAQILFYGAEVIRFGLPVGEQP